MRFFLKPLYRIKRIEADQISEARKLSRLANRCLMDLDIVTKSSDKRKSYRGDLSATYFLVQ